MTQYEMELRPNSLLIAILSMLFLSAFIAVIFLDVFLIFKVLLMLALILYGIDVAERYIFLSNKNSIQKIYWNPGEGWRVELALSSSRAQSRDLLPCARSLFEEILRCAQDDDGRRSLDCARDDGSSRKDDSDGAVPAELLHNSIFTSAFLLLNFKVPTGKIATAIIFLTKKNHCAFRALIRIHSFQNAGQ